MRIDYYAEEKHGEVEGSAIDNEVLDSSRKVLSKTPFGATPGSTKFVGLQQWFTPPEIAKFAAALIGPSTPVLDFTAGSGAMMQSFHPGYRFGIELDKRHVERNNAAGEEAYVALQGDAQRAVPMMRAINMHFYGIAINPPFGLTWKDPVHGNGEIPSVKLAYLWAQDLLARSGHGIMLCDQDDLARNVLRTPEAKGIYAVINLEGQVFPGVQTKVALAIFLHHENIRPHYTEPEQYRAFHSVSKDGLMGLLDGLRRTRQAAQAYMVMDRGLHPSSVPDVIGNDFKGLITEYNRRRTLQEKGKAAIKNDLELKGGKVHVYLNAYARKLLEEKGDRVGIELLHRQPVTYFATNLRDWHKAQEAEEKRLITIGDPLKKAIKEVMDQAQRTTTPLFPVKRPMRLGWLEDVHEITCIRTDTERGFTAGKSYSIRCDKKVHTEKYEEPREDKKKKRKILRQFERQRKLLHIVIQTDFGTPLDLDEQNANIDYLEKHFEIPDPGDVATLFPEEYEANVKLLREIEEEIRENDKKWQLANNPGEEYKPFAFKNFQVDHMARLLIKERGLLAHEQGLGKTLMQLTLAEAQVRKGARRVKIFVTMQDLIPQWQEQSLRFFGKELETITTVAKAREVKRRLEGKRGMPKRTWIPAPEDSETGGGHWQVEKRGAWIQEPEEGEFITYYEALSRVGRKYEALPEAPVMPESRLARDQEIFHEAKQIVSDFHILHGIEATPAQLRRKVRTQMDKMSSNRLVEESLLQAMVKANPARLDRMSYAQAEKLRDKPATTKYMCPICGIDTAHGWTGEVCRNKPELGYFGCGYVHRKIRKKSGYSALTKCFIDGVICADEISEIRGHSSQRSQALRALARGPHKYGATGTPLSNYVNDCFWGLWWCLGNSSLAFPYDYAGGRAKFEEDFCVVEWMLGEKGTSKEGQRDGNKRVLPMITNVSQFWRLTQPGVSRCRKEQTGEPIVERTYHLIQVPMGMTQKHMQKFALDQFHHWFEWNDPMHPMVLYELHEKFAMGLGARWWLERTATMPSTLEQLKMPSDKELIPGKDFWAEPWSAFPDDDPIEERRGQPKHPWVDDISDWTPANLKVLQIAMEHAEKGQKVLIGSDLISTGEWLSNRLAEKGVKSVHIAEDKNGKMVTKTPKKRAKEVREFTSGDADVMCAGIAAMKLGHNMDKAQCVIVHGLPDSFMMIDQFIARVHRLTSENPVDIYVVVPEDSLAEKKWELLKDKGGSSDLAFDGELMAQAEEEVDWEQVLKDMKKKGVHFDGSEVHEADVEEQWENLTFTSPRRKRHERNVERGPVLLRAHDVATNTHVEVTAPPEQEKPGEGLLSRLTGKYQPAEKPAEETPKEGLARKQRKKVSENVVSLEEHEKNKALKEGRIKPPKRKKMAATGTDSMFDFGDDGTIEYAQDSLFDI